MPSAPDASARVALRSWPIAAAAGSPRPTTSPTVRARRRPGPSSQNASYQSAPDREPPHPRRVGDAHREILGARQLTGQQALLQRRGDLVSVAAGLEQLLFVATPVAGQEDRDPQAGRLTVGTETDCGVDEDRHPLALGVAQLERDLADRSLHAQQRREVRLVVDPSAGGQQLLEATTVDQFLAAEPDELADGLIGRLDDPGEIGGQQSARRVLEEVLHALRRARTRTAHDARNSAMTATVASGWLRLGQ